MLGEAVLRSQDVGSALEHELGITNCPQRSPEHTARVCIGDSTGDLQGDSRLAGATRSGKGEKPNIGSRDELRHLSKLFLPAEEECRRDRQVGLVQTLESWELLFSELVDALGRGEVLEAVFSEINEVDSEERGG